MFSNGHEVLWRTYFEIFQRARKHNDFVSAQKTLDHALCDAEDFMELDERMIWACHSLGAVYCEQRKYDSAEIVYSRLLEVREKILGPDHPDVADSFEKLAATQLMHQRTSKLLENSDSSVYELLQVSELSKLSSGTLPNQRERRR
ncbi:MAG TPA: tetratricopeptide repeat protein [Candidatus Obscuribacterales bacterium]